MRGRLPAFVAPVAVAAALAAALAAGCYERGRARPADRGEDGGVAAAARDAPATPAWVDPPGPADPAAALALAVEVEPATLDPLAAADLVSRWILADVYEGLVCPGPALGDPPAPCLAERWEVADGGRRWTFHLRPARWHDGEDVRAPDVAAALEAARDGGGPLAGELDGLVRVEADGDRAVVAWFDGDRPDRLARLARVPIARGGAGGAPGALLPGTGPLALRAWRRGQAIELARWDGYWGAPAGAARVTYRIAADRAHALRMLGDGEVDVVVQVPVEEAERFAAAHPGARVFAYRLPAYLAAIYNARRPALATADARRALTALLDRDGLAARLLGAAAITGPFPPSDPGHDPEVRAPPFDRALAARLLGGARPRVEVLVPAGSTTMARVADIWAADARGVADLAVVHVPFGEVIARLRRGEFDVALMSLSTGPELDLTDRLASSAPAEEAWCGIADPELDRLLAEARGAPDPAARAAARRGVHRRIAALQPMAFLAPDLRRGIARAGVGGIADAPEGAPPRASRLWRSRAAR